MGIGQSQGALLSHHQALLHEKHARNFFLKGLSFMLQIEWPCFIPTEAFIMILPLVLPVSSMRHFILPTLSPLIPEECMTATYTVAWVYYRAISYLGPHSELVALCHTVYGPGQCSRYGVYCSRN